MSNLTSRTPGLIAAEINKIKEDTRRVLIYNSIEIGRKLVEAKELVPHGEWGSWLETEVNYSKSTANNLMKVFEEYGSEQISLLGDNLKSQAFGNLTYSQAVLLLGVPGEEREKFVEENNVDEMSTRELKKAIEDLKRAENEKQRALKEKEAAEKRAEEEIRSRQALEDAFNSNAKERKKVEEENSKLENKIKKLEEKISDLNNVNTEISVTTEEVDEEVQAKINELRAEKESLAKEKERLEQKIQLIEANKSDSEIRYKVIFKEVVNDYNELLKALDEIKKENEVAGEKFRTATERFLKTMLERL